MRNIAHLKNFIIKSGDCETKRTLKRTSHTKISEQFECVLIKIVCVILFLYSVAHWKNFSIMSGDCATDEHRDLHSKIEILLY